MDEQRPILNYQRPPPAGRGGLPVRQRWLFGVAAVGVALFAGVSLAAGLIFAIGVGEWHDLLLGVFLAVVAYLLWLPVRLSRRRY